MMSELRRTLAERLEDILVDVIKEANSMLLVIIC